MTRLQWGEAGKRFFRTGISKGVLYPKAAIGVPWNGLISIEEKPSGGSPTPYYLDGHKYGNVPEREEFFATLNAFTYPDEFEVCDGTVTEGNGLYFEHQPRRPFDLSYVVNTGNDLEGKDYGYRIHLLYNVLAAPSNKANNTNGPNVTANAFSWELSTTPLRIPKYAPTAHLIIDSKSTNPYILSVVEDILYGSATEAPRMPSVSELITMFNDEILLIVADPVTGRAMLLEQDVGDLIGDTEVGKYDATKNTRLRETADGRWVL